MLDVGIGQKVSEKMLYLITLRLVKLGSPRLQVVLKPDLVLEYCALLLYLFFGIDLVFVTHLK